MNASNPLFVLKNVACARGGKRLFQNLSCRLEGGEVLHLSGPNGSGKTSLLRIMAGALPATEGEILWNEKPFLENGAEEHAERVAFLPADDRSLKILETANENLAFWGRLAGRADGCAGAMARLGLSDIAHLPVRRLSAGQKRRLSLARILLTGAVLWLLDEPFNGLDPASAKQFHGTLDEHIAQGGMAVIASHHAIAPPKSGRLRHIELGPAA